MILKVTLLDGKWGSRMSKRDSRETSQACIVVLNIQGLTREVGATDRQEEKWMDLRCVWEGRVERIFVGLEWGKLRN